MKVSQLFRFTVLFSFIVVGLLACQNAGEIAVEEGPDPDRPPPRVDLPAPPPASGFEIAERHPDGNFRVEGLIHHQENHIGKRNELSVRGIITWMSEECDPRRAKKTGERCPEPSLFIADEPEGQSRLRVVGYDNDFVKKAKLQVGEQRLFRGEYQRVAQGFVATEDGLLLLNAVDDIRVLEDR